MSSVFCFPDNTVGLCIQKYSGTILSISCLLCNGSICCNHMNKFHVRYLCCDPISMTHIIKSTDPVLTHICLYKKSFIDDPQIFIYISLLQLIPCEFFHLISVMCINLTCLIFISDQVCIQKCTFLIIQRISMHKIQIYRAWKLLMELFRSRCRHIILIELCNFQFCFYCFLIPVEINRFGSASFYKQCTDGRQYHCFIIHLITLHKYIIQMFIKILHLTCQIRCIQCKFLRHQFILHTKKQNLHFKLSEFLKRRTLLFKTAECLKIKPQTMRLVFHKLFLKYIQSFTVNFIFRINLDQHTKNPPAVRMLHKGT